MKKISNVLWGIILILIGVVIGCNVLGIISIRIFFRGWWTLLIIIPCFIGLITDKEKLGSIIGITIGVLLLLCCQKVLEFEMLLKLVIPLILIIIGISFILKSFINKDIQNEIKKLNKERPKDNRYNVAFSSEEINFDGEEFNGADLVATFGGIKCDLRKAVIKNDLVINIKSVFAGIEIYVPKNVRIKTKSNSFFGGIDNKKIDDKSDKNAHTIYIDATCVFGGVNIREL